MKEVGKIIVDKGQYAIVRIERHSACDKCDKNCELSENHESSEMLVEVVNEVNAQEGQKVNLELEKQNLVFSALLVYLLPLLSIILGYIIGDYILSFPNEISGILGALVCLVVSVLLIKIVSSKINFEPRITSIVDKLNGQEKEFNYH